MRKRIFALITLSILYAAGIGIFAATTFEDNVSSRTDWTSSTQVEVTPQANLPVEIIASQRVKAGVVQATQNSTKLEGARYARSVTKNVTSVTEIAGSKTLMAHVYSGSSSTTTGLLRFNTSAVTVNSDSEVSISNFGVDGITVTATVNVSNGTVSFPSQKVYTLTQGDVYLCKYSPETNVYDKSAAVTGTIVGSNIVIEDGFGFFITEGSYAGAYLNVGLFDYAALATSNAEITNKVVTFSSSPYTQDNRTVTTQTIWAYLYQVNENQVRLMHVPAYNGYSSLLINLNYDGSISIDPQVQFTLTYTGNFCAYGATEKVASDGSITLSAQVLSALAGTYADKKLNWGEWIQANTSSGITAIYESTSVALNDALTFPTAPTVKFSGEGTKDSPYLINSAADFANLNYAVRNDATLRGSATDTDEFGSEYTPVLSGKYFKLTADIDYSKYKEKVEPIGTSTLRFDGVLDGDGHTISNFTIKNYAYDYCGLFAATGKNSVVSNLNFESAYVSSLGYTIGLVAGKAGGKVSNVNVNNSSIYATAGYNVGILVGYACDTISNCNVNGFYISSLGYNGGIAGRAYAEILNCATKGRIYMNGSSVFAGGIVGYYGSSIRRKYTIADCSFAGQVTSTNNQIGVGGIGGGLYNAIVTRCTANAQVYNYATSATYVGGLAGCAWQTDASDDFVSGYVCNSSSAAVGGLIGHITTGLSDSESCTFTNCISTAMVASSNKEAKYLLYGNSDTTKIVAKNTYFDSQVASVELEGSSKKTTELTSGTALEGFDTNVWDFTKGRYPSLKTLTDTVTTALAAAALIVDEKENLAEVKSDFTASPKSTVTWRAVVNNAYSTAGGYSFTFTEGSDDSWLCKLNGKAYTDTVYVSKGNYSKFFFTNVAPLDFKGSGSAEDPYLISSKADFEYFSEVSNNASLSFADSYFKMTQDIDFEGDTIVPVCNSTTATPKYTFEGNFDGAGYAVHNFRIVGVGRYGENTDGKDPNEINPKSALSVYNSGLFGNIGANGVVENLTIAADCYVEGFDYAGTVAGTSSGIIRNCANYSQIDAAYGYVGGIVGRMFTGSKTVNCLNAGKVRAGESIAGGIAATVEKGTIESCVNTGLVTAEWYNSYRTDGTQSVAGGIVATASSSTINNVVNAGTVKAYKLVGGIASKVTGTTAAACTISNSVNTGNIEGLTDYSNCGSIAGTNTLGTYVNNYFDSQLANLGGIANANIEGATGLATKDITNGKVALPDSAWTIEAGAYPVPTFAKSIAPAELASKAVVTFADGDNSSYVTSAATLSEAATWTLKNATAFKIAGTQLTVTVPETGVATDSLTATLNGYSKVVALSTLNANILEGAGTKESPFLVKTADDFLKVSSFISSTGYNFGNKYFSVTADLDFTDKTFQPIGSASTAFNGVFDGGNHTISNVTYSAVEKTDSEVGIFGSVGFDGQVNNVVLDKTNDIKGYTKAGGLVGGLYGSVDNVVNNGSVTTTITYAGGVVGYANPSAKITNCTNNGAVTATTNYAGGILGGSLSQANVQLASVTNNGKVTGKVKIGGIVGSASATITKAQNNGDVSATTNYAAGIIAEALLPSGISYAQNHGTLAAPQYLAGIVAYSVAHATTPFVIDSCYNDVDITPGAKGYVGGIGGNLQSGTQIKRCYNTGNIESTVSTNVSVGGITSRLASTAGAPASITDSWNTGKIKAAYTAGGIVAYQSGDSCHIERCYNTGDITTYGTTNAYAGGIGGQVYSNIFDSWNSGNITVAGKYAGGIIGYETTKGVWISRTFNVGNVTSTSTYVGGILGSGRHWVNDCYNFGTVTGSDYVAGIFAFPATCSAETYHIYTGRNYNAGKVVATSASAANVSNTIGVNANCKYLTVNENYYDSSVNGTLALDKSYDTVEGLTTAELVKKEISKDFELQDATYPSLKVFANNDYNNFAVATILLADGERTDSIASSFLVGTPNGAVWTASDNLSINGNVVTPKNTTASEDATLTLTVGSLTRTYNLTLKGIASGVNSNEVAKEVAYRQYFTTSGVQLSAPATDGTPVIEKTVYTDGTTSVKKYIPRR